MRNRASYKIEFTTVTKMYDFYFDDRTSAINAFRELCATYPEAHITFSRIRKRGI